MFQIVYSFQKEFKKNVKKTRTK